MRPSRTRNAVTISLVALVIIMIPYLAFHQSYHFRSQEAALYNDFEDIPETHKKLKSSRRTIKKKKAKPVRPHPNMTDWESGPEYESLISKIRPWIPPAGLNNVSRKGDGWTIVFFRVSTEPLEPFELCCFHSAAVHNPDSVVKILIPSGANLTLPDHFLPNVRFEVMDYERVFKDTPLESWYSAREWEKAPIPLSRIRHVANAARHAYVWKTGSTYLDTDMITLRPLGGLRNSLAFQCTDNSLRNRQGLRDALSANGAFLAFDKGHPYMELVMNVTRDTFRSDAMEGHFGPKMLTRMIPVYQLLRQREHPQWPEMHVLPHEYIYPYRFTEQKQLFGRLNETPKLESNLNVAFTVHLWRNGQRRKNNPHLKTYPGTVLAEIIREHCPKYYMDLVKY